jgi:hypothetical protein
LYGLPGGIPARYVHLFTVCPVLGRSLAMNCETVTIRCDEWNELLKDRQVASHAKRLALELECLLTSTRDTAAQARWWESAHEALDQYRAALDELYPQPYVSPFGKD